jgi:hypothetical protein
MKLRAIMLATALSLASMLPASARADQVRVTGESTADATLIRDAVQQILRIGAGALECHELTAVEASVLPDDWRPADPKYRLGPPGTRYERWEATLCGRAVPFLIGFWDAPEGGTMFQVGYPFPAAAEGAANP